MMKPLLITLSFLLIIIAVQAQSFESPQIAFNQAANQYIFNHLEQAVKTLNLALKDYPDDKKLRDLLDKILKDRQKQEQEQKQQNQQEKQDQQKQQEEQQQEQQQNQEEKQEQQQENQSDEEKKDAEKQQQEQKESDKTDEEKEDGEESMQVEQSDKKENKDEKELPQIQKNLEDLNISPEKARMILEAMKNNEVQYIQQMQRKPTQKPDGDKPDW